MTTKRLHCRILLLLSLILLSSCTHLVQLNRAQQSFNRGAELENQLKFNPQPESSLSPGIYYTLAYAELEKSLNNKNRLKQDHVLGSAYTVKALCEWKLQLYDEAARSAEEALSAFILMEEKHGIRMPRDKAMMQALPALIEIDKAKSNLYAFHAPDTASFAEGQAHFLAHIYHPDSLREGRLEAAVQKLGSLKASTAENEELNAYFTLAQLAALKTWSDGIDFIRQCITGDDSLEGDAKAAAIAWYDEQQREDAHLYLQKKKLLEQLEKLKLGQRGEALIAFWNQKI